MVDPFEFYFGKLDQKQNKEMDHMHFSISKKIDELKGKAPQLARKLDRKIKKAKDSDESSELELSQ